MCIACKLYVYVEGGEKRYMISEDKFHGIFLHTFNVIGCCFCTASKYHSEGFKGHA